MNSSKDDAIRFFFSHGSRRALYRWLEFRIFVAANAARSLKLTAETHSLGPFELLQQWDNQYLDRQALLPGYRLIVLLMAFFGAVAMAGVLNYPRHYPINVFIPLALFALLPLLLTVTSALLAIRPERHGLAGHPVIGRFIKRFRLTVYLPYQSMLMRWIFWQFQSLSLAFIGGALMSFFVLATFQDYQFGWSSTLISNNMTMVNAVAFISWPWHWWVSTPGIDAVNMSRFYAGTPANNADDFWWQTLVLAIVFYGLLPRFLLMQYLHWRYVRALKKNIRQSGDLELFFVAQQHKQSKNALSDKVYDAELATISVVELNAPLVGWHFSARSLALIKQLGVDSWEQDQQWLLSDSVRQLKNVHVLVNALTAPTGELADCIGLLPGPVTLVICFDDQHLSRVEAQKKSWQYFAQQQSVAIKVGI